jgi:hypothetical protein
LNRWHARLDALDDAGGAGGAVAAHRDQGQLIVDALQTALPKRASG